MRLFFSVMLFFMLAFASNAYAQWSIYNTQQTPGSPSWTFDRANQESQAAVRGQNPTQEQYRSSQRIERRSVQRQDARIQTVQPLEPGTVRMQPQVPGEMQPVYEGDTDIDAGAQSDTGE